jgi:GNAT superfamily N-acetyltransferase
MYFTKILTILDRKRYWGNNDEHDSNHLWPGLTPAFKQWLSPFNTFVIGVFDNDIGQLTSRAEFKQSETIPDLWLYGFLYTYPEYRRKSLGEKLLADALKHIGIKGAKYCCCIISRKNKASMSLNKRLGFYETEITRIVMRGKKSTGRLKTDYIGRRNLIEVPEACELFEKVGPKLQEHTLYDSFNCSKSLLPWKPQNQHLYKLNFENRFSGFARIEDDHINIIVNQSALCNINSIVGELIAINRTANVVVYTNINWLPEDDWPHEQQDVIMLKQLY